MLNIRLLTNIVDVLCGLKLQGNIWNAYRTTDHTCLLHSTRAISSVMVKFCFSQNKIVPNLAEQN